MRVTAITRRRHRSDDSEDASVTRELLADARTCLVLTFLLGITWSVGYLIRGEMAKYAGFAFVAANGGAGIFTLMHAVVLNESVRGEVLVRLGLQKGKYIFTPGKGSRMVKRSNMGEKKAYLRRRSTKPTVPQERSEYEMNEDRNASRANSDTTSLDTSSLSAVATIDASPQSPKIPLRRFTSMPVQVTDRRHSSM